MLKYSHIARSLNALVAFVNIKHIITVLGTSQAAFHIYPNRSALSGRRYIPQYHLYVGRANPASVSNVVSLRW